VDVGLKEIASQARNMISYTTSVDVWSAL
jgi:hypothetical protein